MTLEEPTGSVADDVFVFPASSAQRRLWFLDQLRPGTCVYNVPTVLRLVGMLNLAALEQSFNQIVQRHESLRTTFGVFEGEPVQAIAPHLKIALPLVDLRTVSDRETIAQNLISQEIQHPFNLSQSPLLRLLLLQLDDAEFLLLVNLHHIVFDEWSSGLLIRELGVLYAAFCVGKSSPLGDLSIQYADFAHWQHRSMPDILEAHLPYWRQQLESVPVLELPTDRPRSQVQSDRGSIQQLELSEDLTEALKTLSQQAGVTLFMLLLAAFQTLLHRYTGQTDIAVGSPIAHRNCSELEELIGFFVNSLVLRTDLSGDPTFLQLLERVREVALAAYAHQDLPFEKLVEELQPARNLSHNPLFQVVFALQNAPMQQLELPGLTLSSVSVETKTTRFDLEVYVWECSENFRTLWGQGWTYSTGLRGIVVYNTDLFDSKTISHLLESFQIMLKDIVKNPNQRLSEIQILTQLQRQQVLVEWNNTHRSYPHQHCIHELFQKQVMQSPNAIAVQFHDRHTYDQLNRGSNQLAHYLQKLGVGVGSRVGVCLDQSSGAIAALLSILKAGAAYVPLDPSYPSERLQWMLEDAEVSVVLTQQQWVKPLGQVAKLICLDQAWQTIAQEPEENLPSQTTAENLAYVIYTSGSTGTPKGVAVPHRAVNRLVCNCDYVQLTPSDRIAQVSNLAFDAATFEIWGALLNGAQLVGIDRETLLSPPAFAIQIQEHSISVLFLTTALFHQFAREIPSAFAALRYLLFGGEAIDPNAVRTVLEDVPQHLLHVYGPTENTTFTCWYEVRDVAEAVAIPIGHPIANTQIYLLDAHLNPVPIGVRGELYIGGDGLAQGYLNRPQLTSESFIQNPFDAENSELLYKTGDLARYLPDGNLEFLGRIDNQIKLRGYRIELGEIETVLNQFAGVQGAIVQLHADNSDHKHLVAYLVLDQDAVLTESALRKFLKAKLPEYMVPAVFVILEAFPLTLNGKIDRRVLSPTKGVQITETPALQAPETTLEQSLAQLWTQLLGRSPIGIHENFFELGGHSLLATQLISRMRDRFALEIPLRSLFETPTIAGLANQIETMRWANQEGQVATGVGREEVEF